MEKRRTDVSYILSLNVGFHNAPLPTKTRIHKPRGLKFRPICVCVYVPSALDISPLGGGRGGGGVGVGGWGGVGGGATQPRL